MTPDTPQTEGPPREWWIAYDGTIALHEEPFPNACEDGAWFHVIEYSAMDEAANKILALEANISKHEQEGLTFRNECAALTERNRQLEEWVEQTKHVGGNNKALRAQLDEIISYMPKIPTEPYEKRLAREATEMRSLACDLARALKASLEMHDDLSGILSKHGYENQDRDECNFDIMYNGTMASYKAQFKEAADKARAAGCLE